MTIDEFFTELEKLNLKWSLSDYGGVVRCSRGYCPITALAVERKLIDDEINTDVNSNYTSLGNKLGLEASDITAIVDAADFSFYSVQRGLIEREKLNSVRERLVKLCQ